METVLMWGIILTELSEVEVPPHTTMSGTIL